MLGFLVSQTLQQKSNEITITTDQYLNMEIRDIVTDKILGYEDNSHESLEFMLNIMVSLESMGLLTFAVDYDKTMHVKLNPQVFQYFITVPDEVLHDIILGDQKITDERQALGEDEENIVQSSCKVIPFPK
jgi:hypothetical protein